MVFVIFLALSENEGRIGNMVEPQKARLDRELQKAQTHVKEYISSKKQEYKDRLNEQIDRVEMKITRLIFEDDAAVTDQEAQENKNQRQE